MADHRAMNPTRYLPVLSALLALVLIAVATAGVADGLAFAW